MSALAASQRSIQPILTNECSNCLAFGWDQPEPTILKKCKQCKVLQYCSESCQKEHWKLVHKQHCKKIASAKDEDPGVPVGMYSHHPFSVSKPIDPIEALVILIQKVLAKMQYKEQSVYTSVCCHLTKLEAGMSNCRAITWSERKMYPEEFKNFSWPFSCRLFGTTSQIFDLDLFKQDSWRTLHLLWGRLVGCKSVIMVNALKNPQETVPEEFWIGLQKEVGIFPNRVVELIKAFSGNQIPSFGELLTIFCGGSLCQTCSFCRTKMIVNAVNGEFKGCYHRVPTVTVVPFMPPMYSCGSEKCDKEIVVEENIYRKLFTGLALTHLRLRPSMCDYCFMLPEKAHRYEYGW